MVPDKEDIPENQLTRNENEVIDLLELMFQYPSAITILAEILIKQKITASDLLSSTTINVKKTVLYQRLNELEQYNLIYSKKESDTSSGRKYTKKFYYPNMQVFNAFTSDIDNLSDEKPRDSRLFLLYGIQALIQREIRKYAHYDNTTVKELIAQNLKEGVPNYYTTILDLETQELVEKVQFKMREIVHFIGEEKEKLRSDSTERNNTSPIPPLFFFFSILDHSKSFERDIQSS